MKKLPVSAIILVVAVFLAFTVGFFLGRNTGHAPIQVSTASTGEVLVINSKTSPQPSEASSDATTEGEVAVFSEEPTESTSASGLVNINTATVEELDTLPGIGPVLAQRIVDYREKNGLFSSVEELILVSGIGEKKLEAMLDLITVE